jgi:hypothetical protein
MDKENNPKEEESQTIEPPIHTLPYCPSDNYNTLPRLL